jgi:hypothetical protein
MSGGKRLIGKIEFSPRYLAHCFVLAVSRYRKTNEVQNPGEMFFHFEYFKEEKMDAASKNKRLLIKTSNS